MYGQKSEHDGSADFSTDVDEEKRCRSPEMTNSKRDAMQMKVAPTLTSPGAIMPPPLLRPSIGQKIRGPQFVRRSPGQNTHWITSTPITGSYEGRRTTRYLRTAAKRVSKMYESLECESEDSGKDVEEHCDQGLDEQLQNCEEQIKLSFALNCDEVTCARSYSISSEGSDADIESLSSDDIVVNANANDNDMQELRQLLNQKESDLELAAQIGQTLLEKNRELLQQKEKLEEQVTSAREEAFQLRHEMNLKEDLLHMYVDDDVDSSGAPSPVKELRHCGRTALHAHITSLQSKIKVLENENSDLKQEKEYLENKTDELASTEQRLASGAMEEIQVMKQELDEANENVALLSEELARKHAESSQQREEISRLLSEIVDLKSNVRQLEVENEEMHFQMSTVNANNHDLTNQIRIMEQRYQEVSFMLHETREEAQLIKDHSLSVIDESVPFGMSLAAELERTTGKVDQMNSYMSLTERNEFQTDMDATSDGSDNVVAATVKLTQAEKNRAPTHLGYHATYEMVDSSNQSPNDSLKTSSTNESQKEEPHFIISHDTQECSMLSQTEKQSQFRNNICQSFRLTRGYRKLQIVKPLEGSATLNHWKYLAERDHLLATLQPEIEMQEGIITRTNEALSNSRNSSTCSFSAYDSSSEFSRSSCEENCSDVDSGLASDDALPSPSTSLQETSTEAGVSRTRYASEIVTSAARGVVKSFLNCCAYVM